MFVGLARPAPGFREIPRLDFLGAHMLIICSIFSSLYFVPDLLIILTAVEQHFPGISVPMITASGNDIARDWLLLGSLRCVVLVRARLGRIHAYIFYLSFKHIQF